MGWRANNKGQLCSSPSGVVLCCASFSTVEARAQAFWWCAFAGGVLGTLCLEYCPGLYALVPLFQNEKTLYITATTIINIIVFLWIRDRSLAAYSCCREAWRLRCKYFWPSPCPRLVLGASTMCVELTTNEMHLLYHTDVWLALSMVSGRSPV